MQLCINYYLLLFISLSVINFGIKVKNCVQMRKKVIINILEESENRKSVKKACKICRLNDYRRKFEIEMKQWNRNRWYETFTANKIETFNYRLGRKRDYVHWLFEKKSVHKYIILETLCFMRYE